MYDLVILVIGSQGEVYDELVKLYWKPLINQVRQKYPDKVKIFLLYGDSYNKSLEVKSNSVLQFPMKETMIPGILDKTLLAFQHILKKLDFRYVFRTNLSTFIDIDKLLCKIEEFNKDLYVYAGHIHFHIEKLRFIGGDGMLLNWRTVNYIFKYRKKLNRKLIDDVAIGYFMKKRCEIKWITRFVFNRYDECNGEEEFQRKLEDDYKKAIQEGHCRFRIKNSKDRKLDIKIFKYLIQKK